jgi:hypothetical protein
MHRFLAASLLFLLFSNRNIPAEEAKLYLKGSGWYQFGRIMHSTDTLNPVFNYDGNWEQNSGAQFTVIADIDEHMQGAMGLGGMQFHSAQGTPYNAANNALFTFGFAPYITEARMTYFFGEREHSPFTINFGLFPYQYNKDVKNLGAYLFRGPVYPGVLISEFESKSLDTTIGNILGLQVRNNIGENFTHDLIFRSETEYPPVFDVSIAYVANLKLGKMFELGAGVNFNRAIPMVAAATNLTDTGAFKISNTGPGRYDNNYAYLQPHVIGKKSDGITDSIYYDTTLLSHQGIKVMGRFSFDPKPIFSDGDDGILGPNDLKLYGEAAVIGIKSYKGVFPDIKQRIPVMAGFVIPTFRLLDELSLEVEYYAAPFRDDLRRLIAEADPTPQGNGNYSRQPDSAGNYHGVKFEDPYDVTKMRKDNLKWSVHGSRTFANCFRLSFQAANDHFKPNTQLNSDPALVTQMESAFTTLKDWYLMMNMGFFF